MKTLALSVDANGAPALLPTGEILKGSWTAAHTASQEEAKGLLGPQHVTVPQTEKKLTTAVNAPTLGKLVPAEVRISRADQEKFTAAQKNALGDQKAEKYIQEVGLDARTLRGLALMNILGIWIGYKIGAFGLIVNLLLLWITAGIWKDYTFRVLREWLTLSNQLTRAQRNWFRASNQWWYFKYLLVFLFVTLAANGYMLYGAGSQLINKNLHPEAPKLSIAKKLPAVKSGHHKKHR